MPHGWPAMRKEWQACLRWASTNLECVTQFIHEEVITKKQAAGTTDADLGVLFADWMNRRLWGEADPRNPVEAEQP